MGLFIRKESETQYNPVFESEFEDMPGGATIETADFKTTTVNVAKGALLGTCSTAGLLRICKTVEVNAAGETKTIKVEKEHEFKVGDFLCNGVKSSVINTITTSNEDYDSFILETGFSVAVDDVLYEGSAEGLEVDDIAPKFDAMGMLKNTIKIRERDSNENLVTLYNVGVSVIVRGTVNEDMCPYPISAKAKTSLTDRIRFV